MCINNMAFFKTHLRGKSSERSRPESPSVSVMRRKSKSSSSRTASGPGTEKQDEIDVEVEHLFQQATNTNRDHASGRGDPNAESSLFYRLMKPKDPSSKLTGLTADIKRSFSQRARPKISIEQKANDNTATRGSSPDFASETSYDSDAAFIPSPRFSEQSWDSVNRSAPMPLDRTMTSLNQVLANDMKLRSDSKDISEASALPSMHPQPNVLSVSKRRKAEHPDNNAGSYSRWLPSIHLSSEVERKEHFPAVIQNVPKKSRFTELFDHPGFLDEASLEQPRKVSIGWMSDGKRYGYGYSFVEKDENNTSCATDGLDISLETEERESSLDQDDTSNASFTTAVLADGLSETEETGSSTDVTLVNDQDAVMLSQPNFDASSEPDDKEFVFVPEKELIKSIARNSSEPELVSSCKQRHRWSLFPSYTRAERNKPIDPNDTVIVRDFCTKASPDIPQQEEDGEEKQRHLITNAIRQGFHDTFLWVIGLGKREIARYHAGFQVRAARSHEMIDPTYEMTAPFWGHVPKEELGDYHIEAWRAAKRSPKKRSPRLKRFRASVTHTVDAASWKARKKSTPSASSSSSSLPSLNQRLRVSLPYDLESGRYVGRRHSAKF